MSLLNHIQDFVIHFVKGLFSELSLGLRGVSQFLTVSSTVKDCPTKAQSSEVQVKGFKVLTIKLVLMPSFYISGYTLFLIKWMGNRLKIVLFSSKWFERSLRILEINSEQH